MSNLSVNNRASLEPPGSEQAANPEKAFVVTHPWIHHYEPGVPAQLEIPEQPLTWLLERTASRYPDRTALIYFGRRLSYAELAQGAHRFATALQRLGVHKGERVAIALPNIPQYPIAFYGALLAGAVVVPTNPRYTERESKALHVVSEPGIAQPPAVVDEGGVVRVATRGALQQPGQWLIGNLKVSRNSLLIVAYPRMGYDERLILPGLLYKFVRF